AVASEPPASGSTTVDHLFGVSTANNALVVVNASDNSQRQLFENGFNGVGTGANDQLALMAPSSVVVTGRDGYVLVASEANHTITEFKLDSTTGNLTYEGATTFTGSGNYFSEMSYSNGELTLLGSDGVATVSIDSNGTLGALDVVSHTGASDVASNSQATYYVDASAGTLTGVFNTGNGGSQVVTVAATAANGLTGASLVAVSTDGNFVYVASAANGTLATFQVEKTGSTYSLVNIQTLRDGDSLGTEGLDGAA